jgi:hypothetical protein
MCTPFTVKVMAKLAKLAKGSAAANIAKKLLSSTRFKGQVHTETVYVLLLKLVPFCNNSNDW